MRVFLAVLCVGGTVVVWVLGSILTQVLFEEGSYPKPLFLTYVSSVFYCLCFLGAYFEGDGIGGDGEIPSTGIGNGMSDCEIDEEAEIRRQKLDEKRHREDDNYLEEGQRGRSTKPRPLGTR